MKRILCLLLTLLSVSAFFYGCASESEAPDPAPTASVETAAPTESPSRPDNGSEPDLSAIPPYSGNAYVPYHDNEPEFSAADITTDSYEFYSELDALGRCGYAMACLGEDLFPTESRTSISRVIPTGWQSVKYDFVDGKHLYNRCHLIGFQLAGENANEKNLITGTRYLNSTGMLPFENLVADYIKETGNHVMYRVTPVFNGDNLVADGVIMEGLSVEDEGDGVFFSVFCYNVQPGVIIDYATGESTPEDPDGGEPVLSYILNTKTKRFHSTDCRLALTISNANRDTATCTRSELIARGYAACRQCRP